MARAFAFALLPAASSSGGLALAPIIALAGAVSAPRLLFRTPPPIFWAPLGLAIAFTAWTAATCLWSPYPDHSQALRFAAMLATGVTFAAAASANPDARRLTLAAALAATLVLLVLLYIEAFADMPLSRIATPTDIDWLIARNPGRGASILTVMVWGVAVALMTSWRSGRRTLGAALLIANLVMAAQFYQTLNFVAAGAGTFVLMVAFLFPRMALLATSGLMSLWLLAAPFATSWLLAGRAAWIDQLPYGLGVRLEIWNYAAQRALEKPILGHGLDAARTMSEPLQFRGSVEDLMPLHPHNASLQIWMETGAIGAVLSAAAIMFAGLAMARTLSRSGAAAAAATLASIGLLANTTYGVWQEWWVATICAAAAIVAALPTDSQPKP